MAAIVVSLATSLSSSSYSLNALRSSSSSLFFSKLGPVRSVAVPGFGFRVVSFGVVHQGRGPFCFYSSGRREGKFMAHSIARATLGLTQPAQIEPPKVPSLSRFCFLVCWFCS